MYSVKWIKSSLFFPWWDGTVDCWQCYLLATSWKGTSTTWNSIWVFSESLLWNNSTKAVTREDSGDFCNSCAYIFAICRDNWTAVLCDGGDNNHLSRPPFLSSLGTGSPYYQIKCHVLNGMKMLPCFVSSVSIKWTMDFLSSQPIGSPAFPKIELLTICNFRQWPPQKYYPLTNLLNLF